MPAVQTMHLLKAPGNDDREMRGVMDQRTLVFTEILSFSSGLFESNNGRTRSEQLVPINRESFLCDMWELFP